MTIHLTDHFTLAEMMRTEVRHPNAPPPPAVLMLRKLCYDILEPLRFAQVPGARFRVGPLWVNSGYRCETVNVAVGGAPNSAHLEGRAADITPLHEDVTCIDIMQAVLYSVLPFDKVIFESPATSTWIHIQIAKPNTRPRRQALMCTRPGFFMNWDPRSIA